MRARWVSASLVVLLLVLALTALTLPGAGLSTHQAWGALAGTETGFARTVVAQWRAPRVVAAATVGAALALSGLLFQALTRNALGSPDIIGFSSGAYTGVIAAIVLGYTSFSGQIVGALVGGLATAVLVAVFSLRTRVEGLRIILVGLGISAILSALNRWLLTRGDLQTMMSAASWGAGSLNGIRWPVAAPATAFLLFTMAAVLPLRRELDVLALGDDTAHALGLHVNPFKAILLLTGVVLVGATTAAAGPIAFVALAAPHIAQRLTRAHRVPMVATLLVGACLLTASDIIAQRAFHPTALPVGLVTVVVGGVYLLFYIAKSARNFS